MEKKVDWGKIRYIASWVILIVLFPFTAAVIISQNALPQDLFYPLKRSMENVVLAAASVSPVTRTAFRTDLANRRFNEAEALLLSQKNAEGLTDFVLEIQKTRLDLDNISDPIQKQELETKINNSLSDFDTRLAAVQTQLSQENQTPTPTLSPFPSLSPTPPPPTITPVVTKTAPTLFPSPTIVLPTLPSPPPSQDPSGRVDEVREYIRCLQIHKAAECTPPVASSIHQIRSKENWEERNEKKDDKDKPKERNQKGEKSNGLTNEKNDL